MAPAYRLGSKVDFPEALAALPVSEAEIRAWIQGGFDVRIEKREPHPSDLPGTRTSDSVDRRRNARYRDALWIYHHVVHAKGTAQAAGLVAHLILARGGPRVVEVVAAAARGRTVNLRADDPELVELLFEDGSLTELGRYLVEYWQRTELPDALPDTERASQAAAGRGEDPAAGVAEQDEAPGAGVAQQAGDQGKAGEEGTLDLPDLPGSLQLEADDRRSADPRAGLSFDHILAPPRQLLTVEPSWEEEELTAWVVENWERIDWGFSSPLYLIGSDVALDPRAGDRVDVLAKGGSGQLVVIELTVVEATPLDVSRLQAYMKHLDALGSWRTFGLLVASDFPHRTLNAAEQHPRLRLLRFRSS